MKNSIIIIISILLFTVYGCVSVQIASNKAGWYGQKLSRVFVFIESAEGMDSFRNKLSAGIMNEFMANNIDGIFYVRNPLALEPESDLDKSIEAYGPDQIMMFDLTSVHSTNGKVDGSVFEISIVEKNNGKAVWKGILSVNGPLGIQTATKTSLLKLFEKLKNDGMM